MKYPLILEILLYIAGINYWNVADGSTFGRYKRGWLEDILGNALASLGNETSTPTPSTRKIPSDVTIAQSPSSNTLLIFNETTTSFLNMPVQTSGLPYTTSKASPNATAILGNLLLEIGTEFNDQPESTNNTAFNTTEVPHISTYTANNSVGNFTQQSLDTSVSEKTSVNNGSYTVSPSYPDSRTFDSETTDTVTTLAPNVTASATNGNVTLPQNDTIVLSQINNTFNIEDALKNIWKSLGNNLAQSVGTTTATVATTLPNTASVLGVDPTNAPTETTSGTVANPIINSSNETGETRGTQITGNYLTNILLGLLRNESSSNTTNTPSKPSASDTTLSVGSLLQDGTESNTRVTASVAPNATEYNSSEYTPSSVIHVTRSALDENAINNILQKLFNSTPSAANITSENSTSETAVPLSGANSTNAAHLNATLSTDTETISDTTTDPRNNSLNNTDDSNGIQITDKDLANILSGLLGNTSSTNGSNTTLKPSGSETTPAIGSQLQDGSQTIQHEPGIATSVVRNTTANSLSQLRDDINSSTTPPSLDPNGIRGILQKMINSTDANPNSTTTDNVTEIPFTTNSYLNETETETIFVRATTQDEINNILQKLFTSTSSAANITSENNTPETAGHLSGADSTNATHLNSTLPTNTETISDTTTDPTNNSPNNTEDSNGIQSTDKDLANILSGLFGNTSSTNGSNSTLNPSGSETTPAIGSQLQDGSQTIQHEPGVTTSVVRNTTNSLPQLRDDLNSSTTPPSLYPNAIRGILQELFNSTYENPNSITTDNLTEIPFTTNSYLNESETETIFVRATTQDAINITTRFPRFESSSDGVTNNTSRGVSTTLSPSDGSQSDPGVSTTLSPSDGSQSYLNSSIINNIINKLIYSTTMNYINTETTHEKQSTVVASPTDRLTMSTTQSSLNKGHITDIINRLFNTTKGSFHDTSEIPITVHSTTTLPRETTLPAKTRTVSTLSGKDVSNIINQLLNSSDVDNTTSSTTSSPSTEKSTVSLRTTVLPSTGNVATSSINGPPIQKKSTKSAGYSINRGRSKILQSVLLAMVISLLVAS